MLGVFVDLDIHAFLFKDYDDPPVVGSTGFVYVTFSTATFSTPFSSLRSW